ncbi:MAG: hypothetical protein RIT45_662, partial [Pseudomonadota bacterium]
TGFLYGLKSIWDFLLGSVVELNEGNRAAAREILRGQVRDTIDILDAAVDEWAVQAGRVLGQALAEYEERRESITARQNDVEKYAEALGRKLRFLANCQAPVRDLHAKVEHFAGDLEAAHSRIAASRQPDFQAVVCTDGGMLSLKKAREQDLLILFDLNSSRWKWLEITSGGRTQQFLPVARGKTGSGVSFHEDDGTTRGRRGSVVAPEGAHRFELRLSTLDGVFRFPRR